MNKRMMIEIVVLLLIMAECASCSHKRTRDSDAQLTVAVIEPKRAIEDSMQAIKMALVQSGKFNVIDRGTAFKAAKLEQEAEWKTERDRFNAEKSYAEYGELYGVGSLILPTALCWDKKPLFAADYALCTQQLSIVNAKTGGIIAHCSKQVELATDEILKWDECVEELIENYPKIFEGDKRSDELKEYEQSLGKKKAKQDAEEARKAQLIIERDDKARENPLMKYAPVKTTVDFEEVNDNDPDFIPDPQ